MKRFHIWPMAPALILLLNCPEAPAQQRKLSLAGFKAEHHTKLVRQEKIGEPVPEPPEGMFDRVGYDTMLGKMAAYVSPDPKDGKKHPIIIWRVGGFANSIGGTEWEKAEPDNDQSAAQYRKAGVLMMYHSLRGGNMNPGFIEGCYGEVEDLLAAAAFAKKLPYVDPEQIYLGGHSVGGTLALLAAAMDKNPFKAVIAFGPIHSTAEYGPKNVPFDVEDKMEIAGRAPVIFLNTIGVDTWVIEGTKGNVESLRHMRKFSQNPKVRFVEVPGNHFEILAPLNAVVAKRILAAAKADGDGKFLLDEGELKGAMK
ncbi:MAG TPA: prolyl oligopeptidase family serine peptidase [Prosthecobacter sp.]|nr:prolyl oligopeptidase family serine peptidase [Prosthecobacter sp.]